jgi:hypothetical protein
MEALFTVATILQNNFDWKLFTFAQHSMISNLLLIDFCNLLTLSKVNYDLIVIGPWFCGDDINISIDQQ